jgi:hypothetical protein
MKIKFLIICVLLGVLVSCGSQPKAPQSEAETVDTVNFPEITFDTALFDFGTILEGEQVSYVFKFQNTGKADLLIQKVETSCGCTVPEYDKKPVKAGENGSIKVRFDSHGKDGQQYKTIKVISNCADNIFDLVIKGVVKQSKED